MTAEENSIRALESELRKAGHAQFALSGTVLSFPAWGFEFLAKDARIQPHVDGFAAIVTFEARPQGDDCTGIRVLALGFGGTEAAAAQDAAYQWVLGVFPALRSYVERPGHICEVHKNTMLVGVPDTGERYGWTIHLPPIVWRKYGDCDFEPEVESDEIYRAIFGTVHQFAAHDRLFWLECFASRYPDGKVDATCRYNNNDWPEGRAALLSWAAGWPDTGGCVLSKRQFLMFEPTAVDKLASSERLVEALDDEIARSGGS